MGKIKIGLNGEFVFKICINGFGGFGCFVARVALQSDDAVLFAGDDPIITNDWTVKDGLDAQVLGEPPYKLRSAVEAVKKLILKNHLIFSPEMERTSGENLVHNGVHTSACRNKTGHSLHDKAANSQILTSYTFQPALGSDLPTFSVYDTVLSTFSAYDTLSSSSVKNKTGHSLHDKAANSQILTSYTFQPALGSDLPTFSVYDTVLPTFSAYDTLSSSSVKVVGCNSTTGSGDNVVTHVPDNGTELVTVNIQSEPGVDAMSNSDGFKYFIGPNIPGTLDEVLIQFFYSPLARNCSIFHVYENPKWAARGSVDNRFPESGLIAYPDPISTLFTTLTGQPTSKRLYVLVIDPSRSGLPPVEDIRYIYSFLDQTSVIKVDHNLHYTLLPGEDVSDPVSPLGLHAYPPVQQSALHIQTLEAQVQHYAHQHPVAIQAQQLHTAVQNQRPEPIQGQQLLQQAAPNEAQQQAQHSVGIQAQHPVEIQAQQLDAQIQSQLLEPLQGQQLPQQPPPYQAQQQAQQPAPYQAQQQAQHLVAIQAQQQAQHPVAIQAHQLNAQIQNQQPPPYQAQQLPQQPLPYQAQQQAQHILAIQAQQPPPYQAQQQAQHPVAIQAQQQAQHPVAIQAQQQAQHPVAIQAQQLNAQILNQQLEPLQGQQLPQQVVPIEAQQLPVQGPVLMLPNLQLLPVPVGVDLEGLLPPSVAPPLDDLLFPMLDDEDRQVQKARKGRIWFEDEIQRLVLGMSIRSREWSLVERVVRTKTHGACERYYRDHRVQVNRWVYGLLMLQHQQQQHG